MREQRLQEEWDRTPLLSRKCGQELSPVLQTPPRLHALAKGMMALGLGGVVAGLIWAPETVRAHWLLLSFFGVSLGLAGTLFIALQFVTGAGWSVALRRVPEAMAWLLPVAGAALLAGLIAWPEFYPWTADDYYPHSEWKRLWLQRPFFLARAAIYVVLWSALALPLILHSRRQDDDANFSHTVASRRWSALFLIVFGITIWLASYDWLMSRDPDWVSTVYGVYNFAGLFTAGLATQILLVIWLRRLGPFRNVLTEKHLHDLGKLLFAMSTFWAYLWYCQYMLIWYVNNPEETPYYIQRLQGAWQPLFIANVVLNWVIPFCVLLSSAAKRHPKVLVNVSLVVLAGRWLDLYLMILPEENGFATVVVAVAMTLGALGLYFVVFCHGLAQAALVPINDPYLMAPPKRGQDL